MFNDLFFQGTTDIVVQILQNPASSFDGEYHLKWGSIFNSLHQIANLFSYVWFLKISVANVTLLGLFQFCSSQLNVFRTH